MAQHLLTPRMAGVLDRVRRARHPPMYVMAPDEARRHYTAAAEVLDLPRAPLARVEDLTMAAADGSAMRARLYAVSNERLPVLMYLHGGGFVVGNLETHDSLCRQIAKRAGCAVLAVDYRLAPEHRFPAAVDDAWAAFQALPALAQRLGLDETRLAVGGDSAGGTLAAVVALMARDAGAHLALQLLVTPGTGAHADTPSHRLFAQGFLIERATIEWFFDHTLPRQQRTDWRFAPLEVPDVEGVAPAFVVLAECDPVVDEGLAYADRLRAAGVPVELELARGVTHDFIKMGRVLPEASHALDAIAAALQTAFSGDT